MMIGKLSPGEAREAVNKPNAPPKSIPVKLPIKLALMQTGTYLILRNIIIIPIAAVKRALNQV